MQDNNFRRKHRCIVLYEVADAGVYFIYFYRQLGVCLFSRHRKKSKDIIVRFYKKEMNIKVNR